MYSHVPSKQIEEVVSAVLYDYKEGKLTTVETENLLYDMFIESLRAARMEDHVR
jgi:hypothetical protein